ncbi:hypothetical protein LTR37_019055 [Vermiconidia calcicola]|uniref:Uncharacterized protein n=1 Tax=Vermiconidia calcicola TaxID=1690605 RepID=A0ACC3MFG9_9PEZI|nr:hypothetical protein LTR37_019055 [Vermiconidia calcicola]
MIWRSNNPWEREDLQQLVSIGSHKLFVSASGPARKVDEPVVLFFTGGAAPSISAHWRVYFHDRSGYDRSERGPHGVLTGQQSAQELEELLARISVGPPYMMIGHFFGGIAARAFLERQQPGVVKGVVLADTATELMYELFQPQIPSPALVAIAEGVDWDALTHLRRDMKLTEEEYQIVLDAAARTAPAAEEEDCRATATVLAQCNQFEKHILGEWPVLVIRCNMAHDFRMLYDAGVQKAQGTPEQREEAMSFIRKMETYDDQVRAAQLRLSCCHKYAYFAKVGHDDILRRPEVYINKIRWVMALAASHAGDVRQSSIQGEH